MTKYAYCEVCKKDVEHPIRKPLRTFHKVIWVMLIIASLGILGIVYILYRANKPKTYCPLCLSRVKFSTKPFEKEANEEEEARTPKERILKKAGKELPSRNKKNEKEHPIQEQKVKEQETFCPYCGEDIEPGIKICPYCHTALKTPY
jgi:hypothetical protein